MQGAVSIKWASLGRTSSVSTLLRSIRGAESRRHGIRRFEVSMGTSYQLWISPGTLSMSEGDLGKLGGKHGTISPLSILSPGLRQIGIFQPTTQSPPSSMAGNACTSEDCLPQSEDSHAAGSPRSIGPRGC